jgi:hypothetical protein
MVIDGNRPRLSPKGAAPYLDLLDDIAAARNRRTGEQRNPTKL